MNSKITGFYRKSQSALEFLTTYGWAFLIILIMIGALAYFGILNPRSFLPNRCNFGSEWSCIDYQVTAGTNTIRLRLKNNLGEPTTINNIAVGSSDGANSIYCTATAPSPPVTNVKSGQLIDFVFTGCSLSTYGVIQGEKTKLNITLDYYSVVSGSNYIKQSRGDIYVGVI